MIPKSRRDQRIERISDFLVDLIFGAMVYVIVAVAGGPTWADIGFALLTFYLGRLHTLAEHQRGRR